MTKNQKMLLGVGVLAAAGYLIWKQGQKPAPSTAASFVGKNGNSRKRALAGGNVFTGQPCAKSPADALSSSLTTSLTIGNKTFPKGTPIYECCKPGTWGTSTGSTGCVNPKMTTISTLEQPNFTGTIGSMSTPSVGLSF